MSSKWQWQSRDNLLECLSRIAATGEGDGQREEAKEKREKERHRKREKFMYAHVGKHIRAYLQM